MPSSLPSSLALTSIADGSNIVAADHRTNYSSIQTAVNALITALSGGASGNLLIASSSTSIGWKQLLRGSITGATGAVASGTGFTASRSSAGIYVITFGTAFSATPMVFFQTTDASIRLFAVTAISTAAMTVACENTAGTPTDQNFNFLAIEV